MDQNKIKEIWLIFRCSRCSCCSLFDLSCSSCSGYQPFGNGEMLARCIAENVCMVGIGIGRAKLWTTPGTMNMNKRSRIPKQNKNNPSVEKKIGGGVIKLILLSGLSSKLSLSDIHFLDSVHMFSCYPSHASYSVVTYIPMRKEEGKKISNKG